MHFWRYLVLGFWEMGCIVWDSSLSFFFVFCVFLLEVESVNGVGLIMWKEKGSEKKGEEEEK
jgi:hypothetical protein